MDPNIATVELREITFNTVRDVCALSETLSPAQRKHVADNAVSIAEAHFAGDGAWFRAIYAADKPVGFIMMHREPDEVFLWRLMVAGPHQGKGYGKRAVQLLLDKLKTTGTTELVTSCVPGPDGPRGFYERLGFVPTGEVVAGEDVMVLRF